HLVHLRRTHRGPHLGQFPRHARCDPEVRRLVVPGAVPGEEHRRELVERQPTVGRRIVGGPRCPHDLLVGVALRRTVAPRQPAAPRPPARRPPPRARPPPRRPTARGRTPAACSVPGAGRSTRTTRAALRRTTRGRRSRHRRAPPTPPPRRAGPTPPRSGS